MNTKRYLVAVLVTLFLAFAAWIFLPYQAQSGGADGSPKALSGPSGKFGPVIEMVLPGAKANRPAGLVDLETERTLAEPDFEALDAPADAIIAWISTNRLDISCQVWTTGAACVTYDMIVIPVEGKCWNAITEQALVHNAALASTTHSPRRQLVLGPTRPDTYIFRTAEGTLGILRIAGLTGDRSGVKICYKLVNPKSNDFTSSSTRTQLASH